MQADRQDAVTSVGLLVLRAGVGGYMASHGVGKARMLFGGQFEQFGDPVGLGPHLSLALVAFAELACALLVVAGLATRFAAIPVAATMAVAAFVAHRADPWSMETAVMAFFAGTSKTFASKEPALLYFFPFLALALTGAGRYSLDALIARRRAARVSSRAGHAHPSAGGAA